MSGDGVRKPGIARSGRPSGLKWQAFRQRVLDVGGAFYNLPCYFCNHPFDRPEHAELQHHVPPDVRPDLAWRISNLAVTHGGKHPCPVDGIACNAVAAGNHAPRDSEGIPVPWDEAFIARKSAEARLKRPQAARRATESAPEPQAAPVHVPGVTGRAWLDQDFTDADGWPLASAWDIPNARTGRNGPCDEVPGAYHRGCLFLDKPAPPPAAP